MFANELVAAALMFTALTGTPVEAPAAQITVSGYPEYCGDAALAEHEYTSDIDDQAAGMRCAARLILDRIESGQRIEEDWTWSAAPATVGEFNDPLIEQWQAAGMPSDEAGWLATQALGGAQVKQVPQGGIEVGDGSLAGK